ncbi:MAG: ATP-binding cassette domain-containing protein [Micrococcales bacterium]|nr:ATP-binding cassette domain-containing protein [Micrococcales bacterium]
MNQSVIATTGLTVQIDRSPVLTDISFELVSGEAVALLGSNGSGKSTLVKAILGLIPPAKGQVSLWGQAPGPKVPWEHVAYVPQASQAGSGVPTSAAEVVRAGLITGRRPFPPRRAKDRAINALAQVGLDDQANRPVSELSGGQRQRVLIARALARQAKLLVMDEPLAGLDHDSQHQLVDLLATTEDLTLLVVLHELDAFVHLLTRAVTLDQGRIASDQSLTPLPESTASCPPQPPDDGHLHPERLTKPRTVPRLELGQ